MLLHTIRSILVCFCIQLLFSCGENAASPNKASSIENTQTASELSKSRIAIDAGVIVSDMETSLGFYRDIIGLQVIHELTTSLIGKGRMVQLEHGASLCPQPPSTSLRIR